MEVQAGFDGLCKDGAWIPVKVLIENQGAGLDAVIQLRSAGLNGPASTYRQAINLPSNSHKQVTLDYRPESDLTEVEVYLLAGQREITRANAPVNCISTNDRLFGVLASNPSSFNGLADLDPANGRASVARLEAGDLPDRSPAWQALDYLVVSDLDTGSLTSHQIEALHGWIAGGGVLIVTGGSNWQPAAAGLDPLLPLHPNRTTTVSALLGLPGEAVLSIGDLDPQAETIIDQDGIPILTRMAQGGGAIYYLGADPGLEPLKSWDGLLYLYEQIVNTGTVSPPWADGFQNWDAAVNAVSTLPDLTLPPFNLLCGYLVMYVIALGPINYLVLRRMKRKELAWISIPVLVLAFSLLAFLVGSRGRGKEPVISRLAVVQTWPDARYAQAVGLLGIFSPNRDTYDLEIDGHFLSHPIPNNLNMAPSGGWTFETTAAENTRIPELRVDVAGMNAMGLEGQIPSPAISGELTIHLGKQDISLKGEISNQSGLSLKDAVLLSPGDAWQIGDFKPGENQQFEINLSEGDRASYQPAAPALNTPPGAAFYPPYTGNSNFITDILGPGDYYRDQATYRRYSLLNAFGGYSAPRGIGGGVYLAGWSDGSPITVQFDDQAYRSSDSTLYLIALQPSIAQEDGPIALMPGLFTWSVLEAGSGVFNPAPYDSYLEGGDFSIQYRLNQPIRYSKINRLILHLKSYDRQGPTGFNQYLWDFDQAAWSLLSGVTWGDTTISNPEHFVGPDGEIRLRLEQAGSSAYVPIERADFTLEVEP